MEETIRVNELRYATDLADQAALFDKWIEGLLAIVENLQCHSESAVAESRPSDDPKTPVSSVARGLTDSVSEPEPGAESSAATKLSVDNSSSANQTVPAGATCPTFASALSQSQPREGNEMNVRQEGFLPVRSRRRRRRANRRGGDRDTRNGVGESRARTNGSTLCGAQRVEVKTFHVAGISLDCSAADVISYCRRKKVLATACNLLRSRIWDTQSAKLYVALSHADLVASSDFWPEFVRCRPWERKPPKSAGALSSKDCPSASPQ